MATCCLLSATQVEELNRRTLEKSLICSGRHSRRLTWAQALAWRSPGLLSNVTKEGSGLKVNLEWGQPFLLSSQKPTSANNRHMVEPPEDNPICGSIGNEVIHGGRWVSFNIRT